MERRERTDFDQVLIEGQQRLASGDIDGYWRLMARHDPYAELAGDVAAGRGALAAMATGRLQQAARETRGRELSPREIKVLQHELAEADLQTRQENITNESDIRVTSEQTVKYHDRVFTDAELPKGTYTPHHLQKVMGGFWSTYAGAPTKDVSGANFWKAYGEHKAKDIKGFVSNPVGYVRDVAKASKTLGQSLGHLSDELDRNFFGWLEEIDRSRASGAKPPRKPVPPLSEPEKTTPPGGLKSIDRAVEHGARQSRAAAPTKPADGLDRLQKLFGRPFEHLVQTAQGRVPVDDPAILHADEIDSLMASSAYRQSLHPQAEKTRATVGQWHEATYPGAAQHDDTGRMTRPPRRARPQSAPSWIRDHGPLSLQGPERDTLIGALIPGGRRKPRKRV